MGKKFTGKTVFITGASSGIGAALARSFVSEGAKVAVAARRAEKLESLTKELTQSGHQAIAVTCDVTNPESLEQAAKDVENQLGKTDIIVANAGFGVSDLFVNLNVEDFRRQFETNFFGVLHTIYSFLPHLRETKGQIVLMGSINGRIGSPTATAYSSSKFALNGLAESLDYELQEEGITTTWINPGLIASEIAQVDNQGNFHADKKDPRPKALMMPTDKAAKQMVHAIYKKKSEVIITGHGKVLLWLKKLSPSILHIVFKRMYRGKLEQIKAKRREFS